MRRMYEEDTVEMDEYEVDWHDLIYPSLGIDLGFRYEINTDARCRTPSRRSFPFKYND